jgi:hypothetical protein
MKLCDRVRVCFCAERPERPLLQANRIAYAGLCEFNQLSCDHCRQDVSPVNKPKRLQHVLQDGTQSGNLCGLKALLSFEKFGDWHTRKNYFIRMARVFRKDGVHGRTPLPLEPQQPASFDKAELPVCSKLTIQRAIGNAERGAYALSVPSQAATGNSKKGVKSVRVSDTRSRRLGPVMPMNGPAFPAHAQTAIVCAHCVGVSAGLQRWEMRLSPQA